MLKIPVDDSVGDALSRLFAPAGLNMVALLPVSELEKRWIQVLPRLGETARCQQTLLLVGNAGPDYWAACRRSGWLPDGIDTHPANIAQVAANPVDGFAVDVTNNVLNSLFKPGCHRLLYPILPDADLPSCGIPLQVLGSMAGWHQTSPLGMGIHREFGLWFAYRALVLLDLGEAVRYPEKSATPSESQGVESVCTRCTTLACLSSCPANALTLGGPPDMKLCANYRIQEKSDCANRCLARNACPEAKGLRYNEEQIDYHYSVSLNLLRRRTDI